MTSARCSTCSSRLFFSTDGQGRAVEFCAVCNVAKSPRDERIPELASTPDRHKGKRNGHRDRLARLAKRGIVPEPKERMVMPRVAAGKPSKGRMA